MNKQSFRICTILTSILCHGTVRISITHRLIDFPEHMLNSMHVRTHGRKPASQLLKYDSEVDSRTLSERVRAEQTTNMTR